MTESGGSSPRAHERDGITRRRLIGTGVAAAGAAIVWGSPFPFTGKKIGQSIDSAYAAGSATGPTGTTPPKDPAPAEPPAPARMAYCAVAGNTYPDGKPIKPGTFLDLLYNQPNFDPHYQGANVAVYIQGRGLCCDAPPPGYVRDGFAPGPDVPAGVYPYFRKP